jgi:tripartite-type tricarboxylate transporter receptor subunit TctC
MAALTRIALVAGIIVFAMFNARAADCPQPACFTKPPILVVGSPAGGPTDLLARALAAEMQKSLEQTVTVDNRAGAGGNIGAQFVAKAAADSHTILMVPTTVLTLNPLLYRNPGFDARKDLLAASLVASAPYVLVVNPSVRASSLEEFMALAKKEPGGLSVASAGAGTLSHMLAEQMKDEGRLQLSHVPFKGAGPAMTDVASGQTQSMLLELSAALPLIESGKLKALAITGSSRSKSASNVPTFTERGLKGLESGVTYGLVYPAGTHPNIVSRLASAVKHSQEQPAFQAYLAKAGLEAANPAPEAFASHVNRESARWAKVVKAANVKLD